MRLLLFFLFFSICPQSKAGFWDFVQGLSNRQIPIFRNPLDTMNDVLNNGKKFVDDLKKVDKTAILKSITDQINSVISIDKILNKLKEIINFQDIENKIKNSMNFQEIFNKIIKEIKQKVSLQNFYNELISPLLSPLRKYTQYFFDNRSKFCDQVCQKWYNLPCFLLMNCQQKVKDFKETILLPVIILAIIIVCCCGAYIFFALSNCFKFLKCLLLPVKVIFQNLQKQYRYRHHHKLQSQEDQQINSIPPSSYPVGTIEDKNFNKENCLHQEQQRYQIQPALGAQNIKN